MFQMICGAPLLLSLGIIQGYSDGAFQPNRDITQAQFAVIAIRFANETPGGTSLFSDANEDDWFCTQVTVRLDRRIFRWYVPAIYSITRAQVTAIVNRMLGRSADTAYMDRHTDELRRFSDVEGTHWAYLWRPPTLTVMIWTTAQRNGLASCKPMRREGALAQCH